MSKPLIITLCGDPGGANALVPVLKLISDQDRARTTNFVYGPSKKIFQDQSIDFEELPAKSSLPYVAEIFSRYQPNALLSATSKNEQNWEHLFFEVSRNKNVPSVAVLDFWSNYRERFTDADGNEFVPNAIAVMDQRAKQEMIEIGISSEVIYVTGQPAFDSLAAARNSFTKDIKNKIRKQIGIGESERMILFVSQPLREFYRGHNPLGFDEHDAIKALIPALEKIGGIHLVIRPHPRESPQNYNDYLFNSLRTSVSSDCNSRDVFMAADLVVGMNTMALVESSLLGCKTLSFQPGLKVKNVLPDSWTGMIVTEEDKLIGALQVLLREGREMPNQAVLGTASKNVTELLFSKLDKRTIGTRE